MGFKENNECDISAKLADASTNVVPPAINTNYPIGNMICAVGLGDHYIQRGPIQHPVDVLFG